MAERRELTSILGVLLEERCRSGRPPLKVLSLDSIVALKRQSAAPKDRLMLPALEETLRRSRGMGPVRRWSRYATNPTARNW